MYGKSDTGAGDARRMEAERQAKIAAGLADINKTFAGFDAPFYQRRRARMKKLKS